MVELTSTGKSFCGIQGNPYPFKEHRANAQDAVALVLEKMASGQFELMVLDEINNAPQLRLVDLDQVLDILRRRPKDMHLILTGRDAHPSVIEMANTVSEGRESKYAYREGIEPHPGVDYWTT